MCAYELTHVCSLLEEIANRTGVAATTGLDIAFEGLASDRSHEDIDAITKAIEVALKDGTIDGEGWKAGPERDQRRWILGAATQIKRRMLSAEAFTEYAAKFVECWRIVGTRELLESAHGDLDISISAMLGMFVRKDLIPDDAGETLRRKVSILELLAVPR